jgi:hypothetical protein
MSRRVLFVTTALLIPGRPDSTGGTISNYLALTAMTKMCDLTILLLGPGAAELDDLPDAKIIRSPSPRWRGPALLTCWNPYVQDATHKAIIAHGSFDAVIASTDTVPALTHETIGTASRGIVIQAFENFGPYAPGVTTSTRILMTKQMVLRRFVDARIIRGANVVATNSRYMCRAIRDRFGCAEAQLHILSQHCDLAPSSRIRKPECRQKPAICGKARRSHARRRISCLWQGIPAIWHSPELQVGWVVHQPPKYVCIGKSLDRALAVAGAIRARLN